MASNTSKRVTIKDIAKECSLSIGAVSQALRPTPGSNIKVSDETIRRIQSAAEKLNYRPHTGARSIRLNRFHNIGFFMSKKEGVRLPHGFIQGVHDAALSVGCRLSLTCLPNESDFLATSLINLFKEESLDALIVVNYSDSPSPLHDALGKMRKPIIYLNDKHESNAVYVDDVVGSSRLTQHLIDRGYRKIQFAMRFPSNDVSIDLLHHSRADRMAGYSQTMRKAGLAPDINYISMDNWTGPSRPIHLDQIFANGRPEVVFAYDDELANGIAHALYLANIRIPDEIALAGYNGGYASLSSWLGLTTMKIPTIEMGAATVDMVISLLESPEQKSIASRDFAPELVVGETTR